MGTLLATIALAAVFVAPVAWGQGTPPPIRDESPYPRAKVRTPTPDEEATAFTTDVLRGSIHPTLGKLVPYYQEVSPSEALELAERLQAFLGEHFEVTHVHLGQRWGTFARAKDGASDIKLDSTIWLALDNPTRRTDAVGVRARYYEAPREVDFRGGTLEQFLNHMLPGELQLEIVYLPPEVRSTEIPPIRMKSARPWQAIRLVKELYAGDFSIELLGVSSKGNIQPDAKTLVVSAAPATRARQRLSSEPSVVRIPPASATTATVRKEQEQQQDEILRAIADGIALRGGPSSTFKLKLNPSTGILFVLGSPEEQQLVRRVARAMMPDGANGEDEERDTTEQSAPASTPTPAATPDPKFPSSPPKRPKPPAPTP